MRKIYACCDIGSHSTKLVVAEEHGEKFVILSRFIIKSKGIKRGIITDEDAALLSVKKAITSVENDLGVPIKELLLVLPSDTAEFGMVTGEISLGEEEIGEEEITRVLQAAVSKQDDERILVSINPIFYQVDDSENLKDVLGMTGEKMRVRAVTATITKVAARPFFHLFKRLGIELVDVDFSLVGDFFQGEGKNLRKDAAAVINIGYDKTEIGIFNKGILIKADRLDVGSKWIDKDISFAYNLEKKKCRYLKETFAVSNTRYADVNEIVHIQDRSGNILSINQLKLSEIVESRIHEILTLSKKQINLLTNREIRYIIVTGGISEIAGFEYTLENVFGRSAVLLNTSLLGVRSNSYSSCFGFIQCFSKRSELQNRETTMIPEELLEGTLKKRSKTTNEVGISGIINYFTGNKED